MSLPRDCQFSRLRNPGSAAVELRGECPRLTVDVLDAVSNARRINRTELVNEILGDWAQQKLLESSLVHRVTRGNPEVAEMFPAQAEAS